MKKRVGLVSLVCAVVVASLPLSALADEVAEEVQPLAPVIITEVQTGSATARADEFIELYNTTDEPIELAGWQLRYITASTSSLATVDDPTEKVAIGEAAVVPAGGYFVVYAGAITLPSDVAAEPFDATLPATGGSLVLLAPDQITCELTVQDAVAWGGGRLFGEGVGLVGGTSSTKDRSLQRYANDLSEYVDTADNAHDFASLDLATLSTPPTPGTANQLVLPVVAPTETGSVSLPLPESIANPDCTPPPPSTAPPTTPTDSPPAVIEQSEDGEGTPAAPRPVIPPGNVGLKSPQLSELLPNPAPPHTDANDEFIELYNPNDASFELSGYVLEAGATTKRRYAFPTGTVLQPRSFAAYFSADTRLSLSNSGSQVVLLDPLGSTLARSEPYGTAKDGQAWLLASGTWQWTTKPTPGALNIISAPATKKPAASAAKKSSAVKTVSTPKSASAAADTAETQAFEPASANTPLHPGVLALIAGFALLYGAYEYRHDMANKLHQFREHRAARRAARQSAAGR